MIKCHVVEIQNPDTAYGFWNGSFLEFHEIPRLGEHVIIDDANERHLYEIVHVIHRPMDPDNAPTLVVKTLQWFSPVVNVEFPA